MKTILSNYGFQVNTESNPMDAYSESLAFEPDLITLDLMMPELSGWELCDILRRDPKFKKIPIIIVTAKEDSEDREVAKYLFKVNDYISKPFDAEELVKRVNFALMRKDTLQKQEKDFFETIQIIGNLAEELKIKNENLERQVRLREETIINMMKTLSTALDAKDSYTAGHSERVAELSVKIGKYMGLSHKELLKLERGAILHDIGKLIVDISYISKPGPLTPDEFEIMASHPEVGARILKPLDFLDEEITIVKRHHEAWDGSGYPDGLHGEEIGILPSIVAVADVYDALTSDRSYRPAWPREDALDEIKNLSGKKFNPVVVEILLHIV
jgi:putative nucleotidyltransferase with HDIG domain